MHGQFAEPVTLSLPAAGEEAYTILPGDLARGLLIVCDHAGNALPPGYDTLGLPPAQLERHIAYDIGVAEVTQRLSQALGVPAVLTHYSRLLIDPNRGLDDPTLIMRLSDGAVIPGNRHVDAAERDNRIRRYYQPYHDAITAVLDRALAGGVSLALLSIHSYTKVWKGKPRPWHVGVLWDMDRRLAGPLLGVLGGEPALVVGENEPYSGRLPGDSMWRHGTRRGLAHALVEIRQDLIEDSGGQELWASRLARALRGIAAEPDLAFGFQRGDRDSESFYADRSAEVAPVITRPEAP